MHKVHRPALVHGLRLCQGNRLLPDEAIFRLDTQVQLQFTVYPVNPLVIPAVTLDVAQEQEAQPESPVTLIRGQPNQPVSDLRVLVALLWLVAVAGLTDAVGLARQPDADAAFSDGLPGQGAPPERLYHFFSRASLRSSDFSLSSAYIFFRRRFSSSSSFSRVIREASIPPYLARHL